MDKKEKQQALDGSLPGSCAGRSIVETYEDVLDGLMHWLMGTDMETADPAEVAEMKGRAAAVAECIAIIRNPYYPNVDVIKTEAYNRWEQATFREEEPPAHPAA